MPVARPTVKKQPIRLQDLIALLLVGDAVMSIVRPKAHARLWKIGPEPIRDGLAHLEDNPALMLAAGVVELVAGVWLATSAED